MRKGKSYILVALTVFALGLVIISFSFLSLWAKIALQVPKTFTPSSSISVTVLVINDNEKPPLPERFSLSQNYPNPFNPNTIIQYTLAKDCHVELCIYNALGQKVKTLVNQYQNAGYQMVRWDSRDDKGNEIASGIYFYKIKADKYVNVKKMMVLK